MTGTIATMMWTTISTLGFATEDVDVCQSLPEIASPQEYDTVTLAIMRETQPQYCSEPTPVGVYHMPPQFGMTQSDPEKVGRAAVLSAVFHPQGDRPA